MAKRLVAAGLFIMLAASCSSGSESVPTTTANDPAPVTRAATEPGPELARILSSLAAAVTREHVEVANAFVLANGAIDEASADCGGENLDIAVFPTAEQAEDYGRQGGYPFAAGDGWVIVTETLTLAGRIADALGGTAG
jgi:ABC-type glycerol-3-phosphate transport system substrate-binding protein